MGLYSNDNFNSHAHVERDRLILTPLTIILYFNSHAHVERDVNVTSLAGALYISTHTLTWSVTEQHYD